MNLRFCFPQLSFLALVVSCLLCLCFTEQSVPVMKDKPRRVIDRQNMKFYEHEQSREKENKFSNSWRILNNLSNPHHK